MKRNRIAAATLAVALAALSAVVAPSPAAAASHWPGAPTRIRVAATTSSSISVTSRRTTNTTRYRLYVSRVEADVFYDNLHKSRTTRRVASSKSPKVTVRGLRYSATPYYYRYATVHGRNMRVGKITEVGLKPATPSALRAVTGQNGLYLTWTTENTGGYVITESTDAAMHANRRNFTVVGPTGQFTPPDLRAGQPYYFRVRAVNGPTLSGYSPPVTGVPATGGQSVRVLAYNILDLTFDGKPDPGYASETVASWQSARRQAAAALIESGHADVLSIEEGANWTGKYRGTRQVDTLASLLPGYALADTEPLPWSDQWRSSALDKAGNYILYRTAKWREVGPGGHFAVGDGRMAAWQVLQNKVTGAAFLMVANHLIASGTATGDKQRLAEAQATVTEVQRINSTHGNLPVVYAGDWNSPDVAGQANNGPDRTMRSIRAVDAYQETQSRTNANYRSMNHYTRIAPTGAWHIDRIYTGPGVGVRHWGQLVHLSHGKWFGTIPSDHNPVLADLRIPYGARQ